MGMWSRSSGLTGADYVGRIQPPEVYVVIALGGLSCLALLIVFYAYFILRSPFLYRHPNRKDPCTVTVMANQGLPC
jgi:hypothetical protein